MALIIPLQIEKKDRILIVAPHPDDESIGCGGLLSKYRSQTDILVVTDGSQGSDRISPEELKKIRQSEFESEMAYLGIDRYHLLEFCDGEMMNYPDCFKEIDMKCYTKVFLPNGNDDHPDHTAVFLFAMNRLKSLDYKGDIFQYEVHGPAHDVSHFLDITDEMQTKEKLISFHVSQQTDKYIEKAKALALYRGCMVNNNGRYAEAFLNTPLETYSQDEQLFEREKIIQKLGQNNLMLEKWIRIKRNNCVIPDYLKGKGYKTISIYGYGRVGKLLYDELNGYITVIDVIDKRDLNVNGNRTVKPEDGKKDVDLVIVSPLCEYININTELKRLGYKTIVSLKEVISDILEEEGDIRE